MREPCGYHACCPIPTERALDGSGTGFMTGMDYATCHFPDVAQPARVPPASGADPLSRPTIILSGLAVVRTAVSLVRSAASAVRWAAISVWRSGVASTGMVGLQHASAHVQNAASRHRIAPSRFPLAFRKRIGKA